MAVAHRMYARALFEAAQEADRVGDVAGDLAALAGAMDEVPELRAFLRNPQIEPTGKAAVLEQLTAGADELVRNFVRLAVELTTAHELSDDEATSIVQAIEKSSGRTVEATRTVDPGLIGGIVLQVGSHRADGSVRGRLERLRHELATAQ